MIVEKTFDVIIIGGSYAGLAAAMTLGRSLRKVLVIDGGKPCNRQTPHSHNFLTQDGKTPKEIAEKGKKQVQKYDTVHFINAFASKGFREQDHFTIELDSGEKFQARKLCFASGVKDILPKIQGLSDCWGISVLHCPYCHGYEVRNEKMGILANDDLGFEMSKLISHWTHNLTLFTNGKSSLSEEQTEKLKVHKIQITEKEVSHFEHEQGYIQKIHFKDNSYETLKALFTRTAFQQHSDIPEKLGCEFNEQGYLKVDDFQQTSIPGIFAAGDNTTMFRAVSLALANGHKAGAVINKMLIEEDF